MAGKRELTRGARWWVFPLALLIGCEAPAREPAPPASPDTLRPPLVVLDSGAAQLEPVDQADASFRQFRTQALAALSRRDTTFLYGLLTPDIRNSFGGDDSIAGFKRLWRMEQGGSGVWSALTRVLELGGQMPSDTQFIAPYVYAFWPDSVDAFEYVAVVTANAVARDEPSRAAPAVGRLTHALLRLEEWRAVDGMGLPTDSSWARLALPGGRSVWVSAADVYSPVGWRAFFVKRGGRWLMQLFVAGD